MILRNYKTVGIIIKRTNYSEADRILTVFTKRFGKIKVIAKGVRKITSRRIGNVELFNIAVISLHAGKNFDILTEAEVQTCFPNLRNNLEKMGWAYYVCEIVDGLCPENQENEYIYTKLVQIVNTINNNLINETSDAVDIFSMEILRELGFWPREKMISPKTSCEVIENILEKKIKSNIFLQRINHCK